MISKVFSVKQLSERIGVSVPTLNRWSSIGEGPTRIKMGLRRVGYREDDVNEWLDSRTGYNGRGAKTKK